MANRKSPDLNAGRENHDTLVVDEMDQQVQDAHATSEGQLEVERVLKARGLSEDIVDAAVRVYTLARRNKETDFQAKLKANRYALARFGGENHHNAFRGVLGFDDQYSVVVAEQPSDTLEDATLLTGATRSEIAALAQQSADAVEGDAAPSTLVADEGNFGILPNEHPDATRVASGANFGEDSVRPNPDETLRTRARQRVISQFIMSVLEPPLSPNVSQANSSVAIDSAGDNNVVIEEPVKEVGVRSVALLPEADIKRHVATCRLALKAEGFEAYLEEGAILYGYLLKQQLTSESAMKQVRFFCRQRQLGATIPQATKAANGTGPIIPEHHPEMDEKVEALMRNPPKQGLTRLQIGLIIALGGTCGACVVGTALYNYLTSSVAQNTDAGNGQEQR